MAANPDGWSYQLVCFATHTTARRFRGATPCIDVDGIEARDHSAMAGLQLADTIASAFACAVEPDRYGNCESRYAEELKCATYHRRKNYFSYGVKLVPPHNTMALTPDQQRFVGLFT
jgi:hypothetical protein